VESVFSPTPHFPSLRFLLSGVFFFRFFHPQPPPADSVAGEERWEILLLVSFFFLFFPAERFFLEYNCFPSPVSFSPGCPCMGPPINRANGLFPFVLLFLSFSFSLFQTILDLFIDF